MVKTRLIGIGLPVNVENEQQQHHHEQENNIHYYVYEKAVIYDYLHTTTNHFYYAQYDNVEHLEYDAKHYNFLLYDIRD